jgi:hypothetical protein
VSVRRLLPTTVIAAVALTTTSVAIAAWTVTGTGAAGSRALTMPGGVTPTAAATGTSVTVRWAAATFPGGTAVEGYIVKRYDTTNGAEATVGAGCSGVVTTTSCTETGVPGGTWVYANIPVQGTWQGARSALGNTVTSGSAG